MSVLRRLIVLCCVAAISASGLFGESVPVNPTVKVLPNARTLVPPECVEGGAPTPIIAEAPRETAPSVAVAPPSIDLKTRLRRVQAAAERDDRDEFKRALADARAAVAAYPTGGEREAANDVMQVYSDMEKIWDYAFTSPSGAFIDANGEGGVLTSIVRRYPDYSRFIRDSTLNAGGQVIYPTRETRQFLTAEAAKGLARLGVRMPPRVAEQPPAPAPNPQARRVPPFKPVPNAARSAPHPTTSAHRVSAKPSRKEKAPKKVAEGSVAPPKPRVAEKGGGGEVPVPHKTTGTKTQPQTTVVTPPKPQAAVEPPPSSSSTPQTPIPTTSTTSTAQTPITTTTAAPLPTPTTTTAESTTSAAPATETTTTSTTTSTDQRPAGGGRMNVLFAVILIVVGIGVLIVLFRASD